MLLSYIFGTSVVKYNILNNNRRISYTTVNFFSFLFFSRYNLPIIFMIINNNGIYSGVDEESWKELGQDPATGYLPILIIKSTML